MQQKHRNIAAKYYKGEFFGYQVNMQFNGVTFTRHIGLKDHVDQVACLQAAIDARDSIKQNLTGNPNANLRSLSKVGNGYRVKPENKTGVVGVQLKGNAYRVTWREQGKYKSKCFGFGKNSKNCTKEEALFLAVQHRKAMVAEHYR